jgi:hypothetical protein
MKLSLIASLVCLVSMAGCAATPAPIQQPQVVTVKQLPPPTVKGEMVEDSMVIVEVVEVEIKGEVDPRDYQRLSSLITREVRGIKCVCVNGDPLCRCKLSNGPKNLPQE